MLNSGQFITWYGLENGAEVYGYLTWRTFRNPVVNGEIMGTHKDSRGSYFSSSAIEVLPAKPKTFKVPEDFAPQIVNGKPTSSEVKALGIRLLSGLASSQIKVSAELINVFPDVTLEPVLSGAKVEMFNASTPNAAQSPCTIVCTYDYREGCVFYYHS